MVNVCFGQVEYTVPIEVKDNKDLSEAIIYGDIASFLLSIPEVLKEYPNMKKSIKQDVNLLMALAELGHIVAG